MHVKYLISTSLILVLSSTTTYAQLIREEPNKHFASYVHRVESLTYIASDNSIWQANDSKKTTGGQNPDNPDVLTQTMHNREIFYGASDLGTTSLNWRELETIANDGSNVLYVVNTVNNKNLCGNDIVDEPTIFKLQRTNGSGDFSIVDWHILPNATTCTDRGEPLQSSYAGMVVIDGLIYLAHNRDIRLYDYNRQMFNSTTPELSLASGLPNIRDMAYDGTYLWILGYFATGENPADHWLTKVDWAERRVVESQNLASFDLTAARGLAVNGSELYIGENRNTLKNIHVATIIGSDNSLPPPDTSKIIPSDQLGIATTTSNFPDKVNPRKCSADGKDSINGVEACYLSLDLNSVDLSPYSNAQLNLRVKNGSTSVEIKTYPGVFDEDSVTFKNAPIFGGGVLYTGELMGEMSFDISDILIQESNVFIIEFDALTGDGMSIVPSSINIILQ